MHTLTGWVFPKYDHVAVGTGTVVNKTAIKQYQQVCARVLDSNMLSNGGGGTGWARHRAVT
jgi:flavin-dependent dehydrogenase